jgi:hypothetical protein
MSGIDNALSVFVAKKCPRPNHCCDGKFLQDREKKQQDLDVCQFYDKRLGCQHIDNPIIKRR